jgi:hypothetical protein
VGIGTSSPNVVGYNADNTVLTIKGKSAPGTSQLELQAFGLNANDQALGQITFLDGTTRNALINASRASSSSTAYLAFYTSSGSGIAERMRINSGGQLLVGTASAPSVTSTSLASYGLGFNNDYSGGNAIVINSTSTSSNQYYIGFGRGSAQAGYILSSTTNSTTYSTSSDYRLKNDITPMSNALSKVALLKPCTWKWKLDNTSSQGFIAHELAEVIPEAVAGTKDEVDADGNPRYQGVDTSFVVATLTAAIQELKAELDALKAKVGA